MLTLDLNIGMASKYFITDLDRSLSVLENPSLFLSKEAIGLKLLAKNLAEICNNKVSSGLFSRTPKKIDSEQLEKFLEDLINERKPTLPPIALEEPLLIVANGIEKKALVALKILKIRGMGQLLAIDVSSLPHNETVFRLEMELRTKELYKDEAISLFRSVNNLRVICGISKTIISNELNIKQILSKYPDMAMKFDEKTMFEPLK